MADVVSLIDGDDEDDYEMDLELAIAASLAASQPALRNTGSSCDGQSDGAVPTIAADEDVQLQQALALSMQTYQSEQQQQQQQQQHLQLAGDEDCLLSRKRSCGQADSDSRGHSQAGVQETVASLKRQRSSQVHGQSPSVNAAAALVALVAAARNEVDNSSTVPLSVTAAQQHGSVLPTASYKCGEASATQTKQQQQLLQHGCIEGLGRSGSVQDGCGALSEQPCDHPADHCFNDALGDAAAVSDVSNTSEASGAGLGGHDGSKPLPATQAPDGSGSVNPNAQGLRGSSPDHSSASDLSCARLHYLGQSVWVNSTVFAACYCGRVIAVDGGSSCSAAGLTYTVEVTGAAVKYVEASAGQLQPRLARGDWVWCKPDLASPSQHSHTSCWLHNYQQQQQQQGSGMGSTGQHPQQQQLPRSQPPQSVMSALTVPGGWVRGKVLSALIMQGTAVVEVQLPSQCCIWFPVNQVQLVREIGECSTSAEARGPHRAAAAAGTTVELPAAGAMGTASQAAPGPAGTGDNATTAAAAGMDCSSGDAAAVMIGAPCNDISGQQQQQHQRRQPSEPHLAAAEQLHRNPVQPAEAAMEREASAAVSLGQTIAADLAVGAVVGQHPQHPQPQPQSINAAEGPQGSQLIPPAAVAAAGIDRSHEVPHPAEGSLPRHSQRIGGSGGLGTASSGSRCHPEEVGDSGDAQQLDRTTCCCSGGAAGVDRSPLQPGQQCGVTGECCEGVGETAV